MGSLNPENDAEQLDDSGYVQDEAATKEASPVEVQLKGPPSLLDLSDDVLLYILKHCSPMDLKALGFTCSRLGTLVLDRTLWQYVDAREHPSGKNRVRWLLTHALSVHTSSLLLSGYAREAKGCLGFMSGSRHEDTMPAQETATDGSPTIQPWNIPDPDMLEDEIGGPQLVRLSAQALPRYSGGFPFWPEELPRATSSYRPREPKKPEPTGHQCPGPQVTLTTAALLRLTALCTNLVELALDYCIIDCNTTKIGMFPLSLRKLSLRGTKCFNLEKSFLYKIQDALVHLEDLDVSYCEWVEPACMLPLSKMPRLSRLVMMECPKLSEFVAYASLATRYGFKTLKILDLRGSPVGDSEVSALGWVPLLEQLYLSPAPPAPRHADHAHFSRDPWPRHCELDPWEEQEPDYYKSKYAAEQWVIEEQNSRPNRHNNTGDDSAIGSCVLLQHVVSEPPAPQRERSLSFEAPGYLDQPHQHICGNPAVDLNAPPPPREPYQVTHGARLIAEARREQARERRQSRMRESMGYIISNNGYMRRTINMYPDGDVDPGSFNEPENENEPSEEANSNAQEENSVKRKQGDADSCSEPAKRQRDVAYVPNIACNEPGYSRNEPGSSNKPGSTDNEPGSKDNEPGSLNNESGCKNNEPGSSNNETSCKNNEPGCSNNESGCKNNEPGSSNNESGCKNNEPGSSNNESGSNEPGSSNNESGSTNNEPGSSKHEQCATKAARKYYDDADCCQVSRALLKDSLNDFKKRTEDLHGPIYKPTDDSANDFESDDDQSSDGDDDDEDDDQPQPKRGRLSMIESANKTHVNSQASNSRNVDEAKDLTTGPSRPTAEPSRPYTEPRQPSTESSLPMTEPNLPSTSKQDAKDDYATKYKLLNLIMKYKAKDLSHASTSGQSEPSQNEPNQNEPSQPASDEPKQKFIRFRHNEPPQVVEGCVPNVSIYSDHFNMCNNNDVQEPDWNNGLRVPPQPGPPPNLQDEQINSLYKYHIPGRAPENGSSANVAANGAANNPANGDQPNGDMARHRILYVNVGRRRHAMYQISIPEPVDLRTHRSGTAHMNLIYSSHIAPRLEYTSLVTDAAIRRFGRADGENINYVQIGPMGPIPAPYDDPHARPNRSNLRVLSVTGFRHISNYSLSHLTTAAPHLHTIDFTGTRVTESGVQHFRNLRPDCRVRYGPIDKPREDCGRPHSR